MLAQDSNSGAGPTGVLILILLIALYFLPTIIAANRHVPNVGSVVVINVLLGWTLIGWIVALAMAASSVPSEPQRWRDPRSSFRRAGIPNRRLRPQRSRYRASGFLSRIHHGPSAIRYLGRPEPRTSGKAGFPYSEHGKSEGRARFNTLFEPSAEPLKPLPPTPD